MPHRLSNFPLALLGVGLAAMLAIAPRALLAESPPDSLAPSLPPAARRTVDFARDLAPIFERRCLGCHGEEQQEGRLRLDAAAIVQRGGLSGPLYVAGKSEQSLLIHRLTGLGDAARMPPDEEPLSAEEIGLTRAWIDQGAAWPAGYGSQVEALERHWAYERPQKSPLPQVSDHAWIKNPIDAFVLAKLESLDMRPAPEESRGRLLRRVSLDLIGLPPTLEELDAFLADDSPDAYERAVDRLLASPRYGERWARHWLDLVRYADSNGYQADQLRELWPYRDWVVNAFNDDMPLDQFTREQIAGDLLPNATIDQRVATGMHRSTTCNVEAGVDPEENRVNQVIDRVNVTSTVWLGTTLECAQCHNHKYDPFSQQDYYRLFAFFNNTPLEVKHGGGVQFELAGPTMELPLAAEQTATLESLRTQQKTLQESMRAMQSRTANGSPDSPTAEARSPREQCVDDGAGEDPPSAPLPEAMSLAELRKRLAEINERIKGVKPVSTLVMVELAEPRQTRVFKRGNFLTPGEVVSPGAPRELHPFPDEAPRNRLGLAQWLVCQENPLVGRVFVNRWWAEMFGQGLVETLEDFGIQAEPASHRALLDWLAVDYAEHGWSMKRMHKSIVMSATYRQASETSAAAREADPHNKLLARGPRFRLPAETIRDNALAISGLLTHQLGGPPVFPPQPEAIWRHVGRNAPKYATSSGADRYRRGLYVVWRRSAPYPSFTTFDAPDRAAACVKRPRTNTPLQALALLNDPAYLEISRTLAARLHEASAGRSLEQSLELGFRLAVARSPGEAEQAALQRVYEDQRSRYQQDAPAARSLLGAALAPETDALLAERAAWFYVASVLLNLDETITKN